MLVWCGVRLGQGESPVRLRFNARLDYGLAADAQRSNKGRCITRVNGGRGAATVITAAKGLIWGRIATSAVTIRRVDHRFSLESLLGTIFNRLL